jgi:hypothetical protein
MLKYILTLIIFVYIAGCTFEGANDPTEPVEENVPQSPKPENGAGGQSLALFLEWKASDVNSYDLYFGKDNPPENLYASNIRDRGGDSVNTLFVGGLSSSTTYYWRVVAQLPSGAEVEGPVWRFSTSPQNGSSNSFIMLKKSLYTELPSFVNIQFQVLDIYGKGVADLTRDDFELYEDGEKVSPSESNVEIRKKEETPYNLKTVLMLDNSTSVENEIDEIRNAAIVFVNNLVPQQQVAVYKFSEEPVLVQDFTSNIAALESAINSIKVGFPTTDLYGSVIEGASRWNDMYTEDKIEEGSMLLFTDGEDTQGSHTLSEALSAIEAKKTFTVGLGDEIDPDVLEVLGKNGFYSITDVDELAQTFLTIQDEIRRIANSFYWLRYTSPKRGNNQHEILLRIKKNIQSGESSFITGYFNSNGFYSVEPGLYINSSTSNPDGISTLNLAPDATAQLNAVTYLAENPPDYAWSTANSNIAKISISETDKSKVTVTAVGKSGEETTVTVTDLSNNLSKAVVVKIQ